MPSKKNWLILALSLLLTGPALSQVAWAETPPQATMNASLREMLNDMAAELAETANAARQENYKNQGLNGQMLASRRMVAVRFKEIIRSVGWPGKDRVGSDGAEAAFRIASQLPSSEYLLQAECLKVMETAVHQKQADPTQFATLTDQLRVRSGLSQRFGTQWELSPKDGKTLVYAPIENLPGLSRRRTELGLAPLSVQPSQVSSRKTITHGDLRLTLLTMRDADQTIRQTRDHQETRNPSALPQLNRRLSEVEAKNLTRFKGIVAKIGWPGVSAVGQEAANAAWHLAQHADKDPFFQRKCLDLMKAAVRKGEASSTDLAFLTDRVLVNAGKPQLYGTQYVLKGDKRVPRAIKDPKRVDTRRKSVGLSPLAEYIRLVNLYHGQKK